MSDEMTYQEALREAQRRWGLSAQIKVIGDRSGYAYTIAAWSRDIQNWVCGKGNSFEAAFAAANRPEIVQDISEVNANNDKAGAEGGT